MSSAFSRVTDRRSEARSSSDLTYSQRQLTQERVDGWFSSLTGAGVVGRDKRMSGEFLGEVLDDHTIQDLWLRDDLAAKMIEVAPDEAMRPGWMLNLGDRALAEDVRAELDELHAEEVMLQAKKVERAFGGAAVFPVINDGSSDLRMPLNEQRISRIEHLQIFEPAELRPMRYYGNPLRPKFGEPETYMLFPQSRGVVSGMGGVEIHESRLIIFPGIRVSRMQTTPRLGGDTILNRVFSLLRDYNMSWASVAVLLHDFAQASFKIKGLASLIANDRDDVIKARIQAVELARSTIRAVLMDSEEEFERKSTPTSGLAELLRELLVRMAAAADMPVTRLFGTSPSGLSSTGEHEIRQWYDRVDTMRQRGMRPQFERLSCLQMKSHCSVTRGREPRRWKFLFKPLWQMSDQERASFRKTIADTDSVYMQMGAVSAEEIAKSRWGGDEYSPEMSINFRERELLDELGETVVPPPPQPKGAQPSTQGPGGPPGAMGPKGPTGSAEAPGAPPGPPVEEDVPTEDDPTQLQSGDADTLNEEPTGDPSIDQIPTEAIVQEIDRDQNPETPAEEYITIQVKGHARKIRLRRRRVERADDINMDLILQVGDLRIGDLIGAGWRQDDRDFDESKVERDESGRFSSSGSSSATKERKFKTSSGERRAPRVSKGLDTEQVHKVDGRWKKDRVQLHDDYVKSIQSGVPKSKTPTLYMTGGGPASGKSAGLIKNRETGIPTKDQAVHADPDGAKEYIPEYQDAVDEGDQGAGSLAHEESAHMSQRAVRESLEAGRDVVYDSSGDGGIDKLAMKVQRMRDAGAERVEANYAIVDVDEAIRRSDARAIESGRYVPHDYLRAVHNDVIKTSIAAMERGVFDKMVVWDTNSFPPTKIATYEKSRGITVHDKKLYESYRERGR